MRKTEEKKGNIVRHIQSAKQWLEQAEHAVNSERAARGDLDLILAQAEVQLAQEKRRCMPELPMKIITCLLRPGGMRTAALGGLAVTVLLIFNIWSNYGQGMPIPFAVYFFKNNTQPEISVPKTNPMVIASPVAEYQENREMPGEEKTETAEHHAPRVLATTSNAAAVQTVSAQAPAVQPRQTSVSEQEIRVLMRTAERVLKDTK